MPQTVAADIGHAAGIVAAIAPHAVFDPLLSLRLSRDDSAENDAANDTGRNCGTISATVAMPAPVPYLNDQGIIAGLRW